MSLRSYNMILENINLTEVNIISEQIQILKNKMESEQKSQMKANILCLIKLMEELKENLSYGESTSEKRTTLIQEIIKVNNRTTKDMDFAALTPQRVVGTIAPVIIFSQTATSQQQRSGLTSGLTHDVQPKVQTLNEMRTELASLEKYASDVLNHNTVKLAAARYQVRNLKAQIQELEEREAARIEKAFQGVLHR